MNRWRLVVFIAGLVILGVAGFLLVGPDYLHRQVVVDFEERIPIGHAGQQVEQDVVHAAIKFGFDLRASPSEDARQYLPFLRYLEHATGLSFKLVFASEGEALYDKLGRGAIDIAAVGAVSFIKAQEKYGAIPLVRGLNSENEAEYRSVIVVAPDSPITNSSQLRGKRFAFGSMDSTQGHIIPRIMLLSRDIDLNDLASHEYTGSHQNCANMVISGRFDACGMQDTMAQSLARQGRVRILQASELFPSSGIAANKKLAPDVLEKIRRALIEFEPTGRNQEGLYHWDRTEMPNGFVAAEKDDYSNLSAWMIRLGLVS